MPRNNHDVVGSAGAVLAARLSEESRRKVLLEAGSAYPAGGYPRRVGDKSPARRLYQP